MKNTEFKKINTDIDVIDLTELDGIKHLRKLIQNNNTSSNKHKPKNVIRCKFNDFTFDVDVKNVKIPPIEQGQEVEITIEQPKNLTFQKKNCNADKNSTIKISCKGEYLQFDQFKFKKQPYSSDNKTILDTIVETGATELFGNGSFDTTTKNPTIYNIKQLYYNKYNTFIIPNTNKVNKVFKVQGDKYHIDENSKISFKPKNPEQNEIKATNKKPQLEFLAIDVEKDNSRKSLDITDVPPVDIKASKANNSVKEVELDYEEGVDVIKSQK